MKNNQKHKDYLKKPLKPGDIVILPSIIDGDVVITEHKIHELVDDGMIAIKVDYPEFNGGGVNEYIQSSKVIKRE